jgi:outer membrane protein
MQTNQEINFMRRIGVSLIGLLFVLGMISPVVAKELKIGYVDSDRILDTFEDYRDARQKLQEEERSYIAKAQGMEDVVKQMTDELDQQSLMLSQEAKQERLNRLKEKQNELDAYRREIWGEGGKLYNRNLELSKPVLDKINAAIEKVSRDESYDYVFDAASANIVFALPEYDLTDKVLDQLKK